MASKIVVLGGGVSGLSAAFYLARGLTAKNVRHEIVLLEKGKLGGWIQTEKTGNGVFELGPRGLRTTGFVGLQTLRLASDLGLEEDIINVKADEVSNLNRYIFADKMLHPVPTKWKQFTKPQPPLSKSLASIYLTSFFKSAPVGSETVYDVISGRFGYEIASYYADALARGVFAADISELSLKAAFPGVWWFLKPRKGKMPRKPKLPERIMAITELNGVDLLQKSTQEKWSQWNLEGGLADFITALEGHCEKQNVDIMTNTAVNELKVQENGKFTVKIKSEESEDVLEDVDHVISAIPSHTLSGILAKESDDVSAEQNILQDVGSRLEEIKFVDVGLVNLELEGHPEDILPHQGFGHLVPSCEESKVLGIVYDSCVFPFHDREDFPTTRLTCMMGGSWFNELFGDPEKVKVHDLEQAALESVSEQLKINSEPITIISRLHKQCIPTYRVGHTDLVEGIEDVLKEKKIPLYLGGSSYWGVSVNDCIYNSRYIANFLIEKLSQQ